VPRYQILEIGYPKGVARDGYQSIMKRGPEESGNARSWASVS
jgi:hypothetical protein